MIRCAICNRGLKDPDSQHKGIGPICWARIQKENERHSHEMDDEIQEYVEGDDIILVRTEPDRKTVGRIRCNVPRTIYRHSPTGYNWGYGGSGPADLALNILLLFKDLHFTNKHYQDFKFAFIAGIDQENGGTIKHKDIMNWIAEREKDLFSDVEEEEIFEGEELE